MNWKKVKKGIDYYLSGPLPSMGLIIFFVVGLARITSPLLSGENDPTGVTWWLNSVVILILCFMWHDIINGRNKL